MSNGVSLNSNTTPAMSDQDKRPEEQKTFLDKIKTILLSKGEYEKIEQKLMNDIKKKAAPKRPGSTRRI